MNKDLNQKIINSLIELDKLQRNKAIKDAEIKEHNLRVTALMKSGMGKEIPSEAFELFIEYVNAGVPIGNELIHRVQSECTEKELEILRKHGLNNI